MMAGFVDEDMGDDRAERLAAGKILDPDHNALAKRGPHKARGILPAERRKLLVPCGRVRRSTAPGRRSNRD